MTAYEQFKIIVKYLEERLSNKDLSEQTRAFLQDELARNKRLERLHKLCFDDRRVCTFFTNVEMNRDFDYLEWEYKYYMELKESVEKQFAELSEQDRKYLCLDEDD